MKKNSKIAVLFAALAVSLILTRGASAGDTPAEPKLLGDGSTVELPNFRYDLRYNCALKTMIGHTSSETTSLIDMTLGSKARNAALDAMCVALKADGSAGMRLTYLKDKNLLLGVVPGDVLSTISVGIHCGTGIMSTWGSHGLASIDLTAGSGPDAAARNRLVQRMCRNAGAADVFQLDE